MPLHTIRMATIKKKTGAGEGGEQPELLCIVGKKDGAAPMENAMTNPHKIKYISYQFHFWVYAPKTWKQGLGQISYTYAYSSAMH